MKHEAYNTKEDMIARQIISALFECKGQKLDFDIVRESLLMHMDEINCTKGVSKKVKKLIHKFFGFQNNHNKS